MLDLTGDPEPARARADRRRQAEDLARPRPGSLGCLGGAVRRTADGDRPRAEMGAALQTEGGASRARSPDDLRHARSDRGADLRRQGRGDERRQGGADRHAGGVVRAARAHVRRLFHRLARHEPHAGQGLGLARPRRRRRASTGRRPTRTAERRRDADRRSARLHALSSSAGLPVQVRRVADLGRKRLAYVNLGAQQIVATMPPEMSCDRRSSAKVVFDPAHTHVYVDDIRVPGAAA